MRYAFECMIPVHDTGARVNTRPLEETALAVSQSAVPRYPEPYLVAPFSQVFLPIQDCPCYTSCEVGWRCSTRIAQAILHGIRAFSS